MDAKNVLKWILKWEAVHQGSYYILKYAIAPQLNSRDQQILLTKVPSYLVSSIHALRASYRGIYHLHNLIHATTREQYMYTENTEGDRIIQSNESFLGYLCYDLIHILHQYPALGAMDYVLHHILFISDSLIAGSYRIFLFPFAWLIIGEMTTPLLNIRQIAKLFGKEAPRISNLAFVMGFALTRVLGYGLGLVHLYRSRHFITTHLQHVPAGFRKYLMGLISIGYALNLYWFKIILRNALSK